MDLHQMSYKELERYALIKRVIVKERDTLTQFGRACLQLQMESILALSPQAKGRVERLFQTLQDRLTKALRMAVDLWTMCCAHLTPFAHKLHSLLKSIFKNFFNFPIVKRGHF